MDREALLFDCEDPLGGSPQGTFQSDQYALNRLDKPFPPLKRICRTMGHKGQTKGEA